MKRPHAILIFLTLVLATVCAGCGQQMGRIFYQADQAPVIEQPVVRLAAEVDQPAPAVAGAATQPAAVTLPVATQQAAATQPAVAAVPYTSPRGNIRQLALLTLLGATPGVDTQGSAAKDAAEASLAARSATSVSGGIASLGAPQPRTLAAVVGQRGLQRGYAAGLGFARPVNLFTPQANPLTGPNGRCQQLIRAGFFPNAAACQKYFGR